MANSELQPVFDALRGVMLEAARGMNAAVDQPGRLELNAPWANPAKPKMPMWFGAVRLGKAYVSYHLMPIYSHPRLAQTISPQLRRRMRGKSCFNFRTLEPAVQAELANLTGQAACLYAQPFQLSDRPGSSARRGE